MSRKLASLLGEAEDKVSAELAKLEAATGYQSHDVKMLSQTSLAARLRISDLNLDSEDTTAEELYHALRVKYQRDSEQFQADFKIDAGQSGQYRAINLAAHAVSDLRLWSLKRAYLKSLLRQLPPIRTKKLLGYRSNESMLKRADTVFTAAIAQSHESATWLSKWRKAVDKTPAAQRELSPIRMIATNDHGLTGIFVAKDVSAALIPINNDFDPADSLGQVLEIIKAARDMSGKDLSAEIANLHPTLRWWSSNLHLTTWLDDQAVSFNIFDVARDSINNASFEDRSYQHAGSHIWQKLSAGYNDLMTELTPHEYLASEIRETLPQTVEAEAENA